MNEHPHGRLGNENRKYLKTIYKPKSTETFMKLAPRANSSLPIKCDLRPLVGDIEIYNQGGLASCTANAIAGAYKIMSIIQKGKSVSISRLFVYYNERQMIGKVFEDTGAFIKDGFSSMQNQGSCLETLWPYVESWLLVHLLSHATEKLEIIAQVVTTHN